MARWRCLTVGCNPKLRGHNAQQHAEQTGHRVAKWPVRSAAGKQKQRERNAANPGPYSYRYRNDGSFTLSGADFAWPHGEED